MSISLSFLDENTKSSLDQMGKRHLKDLGNLDKKRADAQKAAAHFGKDAGKLMKQGGGGGVKGVAEMLHQGMGNAAVANLMQGTPLQGLKGNVPTSMKAAVGQQKRRAQADAMKKSGEQQQQQKQSKEQQKQETTKAKTAQKDDQTAQKTDAQDQKQRKIEAKAPTTSKATKASKKRDAQKALVGKKKRTIPGRIGDAKNAAAAKINSGLKTGADAIHGTAGVGLANLGNKLNAGLGDAGQKANSALARPTAKMAGFGAGLRAWGDKANAKIADKSQQANKALAKPTPKIAGFGARLRAWGDKANGKIEKASSRANDALQHKTKSSGLAGLGAKMRSWGDKTNAKIDAKSGQANDWLANKTGGLKKVGDSMRAGGDKANAKLEGANDQFQEAQKPLAQKGKQAGDYLRSVGDRLNNGDGIEDDAAQDGGSGEQLAGQEPTRTTDQDGASEATIAGQEPTRTTDQDGDTGVVEAKDADQGAPVAGDQNEKHTADAKDADKQAGDGGQSQPVAVKPSAELTSVEATSATDTGPAAPAPVLDTEVGEVAENLAETDAEQVKDDADADVDTDAAAGDAGAETEVETEQKAADKEETLPEVSPHEALLKPSEEKLPEEDAQFDPPSPTQGADGQDQQQKAAVKADGELVAEAPEKAAEKVPTVATAKAQAPNGGADIKADPKAPSRKPEDIGKTRTGKESAKTQGAGPKLGAPKTPAGPQVQGAQVSVAKPEKLPEHSEWKDKAQSKMTMPARTVNMPESHGKSNEQPGGKGPDKDAKNPDGSPKKSKAQVQAEAELVGKTGKSKLKTKEGELQTEAKAEADTKKVAAESQRDTKIKAEKQQGDAKVKGEEAKGEQQKKAADGEGEQKKAQAETEAKQKQAQAETEGKQKEAAAKTEEAQKIKAEQTLEKQQITKAEGQTKKEEAQLQKEEVKTNKELEAERAKDQETARSQGETEKEQERAAGETEKAQIRSEGQSKADAAKSKGDRDAAAEIARGQRAADSKRAAGLARKRSLERQARAKKADQSWYEKAWNAVKSAVSSLMNKAKAAWNSAVSVARSLVNKARQVASAIKQRAKSAMSAAWKWVDDKTGGVLTKVANKVKAVVEKVRAKVQEIANKVKQKITALKNRIKNSIKAAWNKFKSAVNAIKAKIKNAINKAKAWAKQKWEEAKQYVKDKIAAAKAYLKEKWDAAVAYVKKRYQEIRDAVVTAVNAVVNAVKNAVTAVWNFYADALKAIGKALAEAWDKFSKWAQEAFVEFWTGPWRDVLIGIAVAVLIAAVTVATGGAGLLLIVAVSAAATGALRAGGEMAARRATVAIKNDPERAKAFGEKMKKKGGDAAVWYDKVDKDETMLGSLKYAGIEGARGAVEGAVSGLVGGAGGAIATRAAAGIAKAGAKEGAKFLAKRGVQKAAEFGVRASVDMGLGLAGDMGTGVMNAELDIALGYKNRKDAYDMHVNRHLTTGGLMARAGGAGLTSSLRMGSHKGPNSSVQDRIVNKVMGQGGQQASKTATQAVTRHVVDMTISGVESGTGAGLQSMAGGQDFMDGFGKGFVGGVGGHAGRLRGEAYGRKFAKTPAATADAPPIKTAGKSDPDMDVKTKPKVDTEVETEVQAKAKKTTPEPEPADATQKMEALTPETVNQRQAKKLQKLLPGNVPGLDPATKIVPDNTPGPLPPGTMTVTDARRYMKTVSAMRKTPTGREALGRIESGKTKVTMERGKGSFAQGDRVNIDPDTRGRHNRAGVVSHEAHHVGTRQEMPDPHVSSRKKYVDGMLRNEAESQAKLMEYHREAGSDSGGQVGVKQYHAAYDAEVAKLKAANPDMPDVEVKAKAQEAGTQALQKVFGDQVPSTSVEKGADGQWKLKEGAPKNYEEHYGMWHDDNSVVGKKAVDAKAKGDNPDIDPKSRPIEADKPPEDLAAPAQKGTKPEPQQAAPSTKKKSQQMIEDSEGRPHDAANPRKTGHAKAHIPDEGQDPVVLAQSRPLKANNTVYRTGKHAHQDLRDIQIRNQAKIDAAPVGQMIKLGEQSTSKIRYGLNSKLGGNPADISFDSVTVTLVKHPDGSVHVVHFAPKYKKLAGPEMPAPMKPRPTGSGDADADVKAKGKGQTDPDGTAPTTKKKTATDDPDLATGAKKKTDGDQTQGAAPKKATPQQVADQPLKANIADLLDSPAGQAKLYRMAQDGLTEAKPKLSKIAEAFEGSDSGALLKKNGQDAFTASVKEKCERKSYGSVGDMGDMVRGRINLKNGADLDVALQKVKAEFPNAKFDIKDGPYPRVHVDVELANGVKFELQVGTHATTKFLEKTMVEIPTSLRAKVGLNEADFHVAKYDILDKVKDPALRAKYGLDDFDATYNTALKKTGTGEFDAKANQKLATDLGQVLKRMEADDPEFLKSLYTKGTHEPKKPSTGGAPKGKQEGMPMPADGPVSKPKIPGSPDDQTTQKLPPVSDNPDPVTQHKQADGTMKDHKATYKKFGDQVFDGEPKLTDVKQGYLADCYLIAAMGAVAKQRPDVIKQMFVDHGDGTVSVTLNTTKNGYIVPPGTKGASTKTIRVTKELPTANNSNPTYAKGDKGVLWPALLEKAYAIHKKDSKYQGLNTGGSTSDAMSDITGKRGSSFSSKNKKNATLLSDLEQGLASGKPLAAGSMGKDALKNNAALKKLADEKDVVAWHAYVVDKVEDGKIHMHNPWGHRHPKPLTPDEFKQLYPNVYVGDAPPMKQAPQPTPANEGATTKGGMGKNGKTPTPEPDPKAPLRMTPEEVAANPLKSHITDLLASPEGQKKVYQMAQDGVAEAAPKVQAIIDKYEGASGGAMIKRNGIDAFVAALKEKCERKNYPNVGKMGDAVRGRISLENGGDVNKVLADIKAAFPRAEFDAKTDSPYPRVHVDITLENGVKFELQLGTHSTTKFLEKTMVAIPTSLHKKVGLTEADFHVAKYDIVDKVKDPALRAKYGMDEFDARYNAALKKTGTGDFDQETSTGLSKDLATIMKRMEADDPEHLKSLYTKDPHGAPAPKKKAEPTAGAAQKPKEGDPDGPVQPAPMKKQEGSDPNGTQKKADGKERTPMTADEIQKRVNTRVKKGAGIDQETMDLWVKEHGLAGAANKMGDALLKSTGLTQAAALQKLKADPQAFFDEHGALVAGAVLRGGMKQAEVDAGTRDLATKPGANLVEFADSLGFTMINQYTTGERAGKILGTGAVMPGRDSGGLTWVNMTDKQNAPGMAGRAVMADYRGKSDQALVAAVPKSMIIPPSKAIETHSLPDWLNRKAYAVKGAMQSAMGKAVGLPPAAIEGPIHLLPKGQRMTQAELDDLSGQIQGSMNTKEMQKKKVVVLAAGTGTAVVAYIIKQELENQEAEERRKRREQQQQQRAMQQTAPSTPVQPSGNK